MFSIIIYLGLIFILIAWIEHPKLIPTKPLIIRKAPSEELEDWLKNFHWGGGMSLKLTSHLPQYKFYSEVVETLLNLARRLGGSYQDSLIFLREGLQLDRQFEKKMKEASLGIWLQMGMMMGLTWAFIGGALLMVDIQISYFQLFLIFLWQVLGLLGLPFLIKKLRRFYFEDIGKLWKIFYILKSFAKVPLSRSEIFNLAGVIELKTISQKSLFPLVNKFKDICERSLKFGGSYEEEVKHLMDELRFLEKWHGELFEKRLTVIKLALLGIFFLPSYLAFILMLLSEVMGQM